MAIMGYTSMALLFDVNVSSSTWNRHNVPISMAKQMENRAQYINSVFYDFMSIQCLNIYPKIK